MRARDVERDLLFPFLALGVRWLVFSSLLFTASKRVLALRSALPSLSPETPARIHRKGQSPASTRSCRSRGVCIGEVDLNRVIAYGSRCFGRHARFVHGQHGRGCSRLRIGFLLRAFVIARRAWTVLSQVRKIVPARVPSDQVIATPSPVDTYTFTSTGFFRASIGIGID